MSNEDTAKIVRLTMWEKYEQYYIADGLESGVFDIKVIKINADLPAFRITWVTLKDFGLNYALLRRTANEVVPKWPYLMCHSLHRETPDNNKSFLFITYGGRDE